MTKLSVFFKANWLSSPHLPGIMLCLATLLALIFSNFSFLSYFYEVFKNIKLVISLGDLSIDKELLFWINDGLMAIFFLLVGLEIKREFIDGHLSSKKQAILPIIAALGGVIIPGTIYSAINWNNTHALRGWAIPTATDIAFAIGVLTALKSRIPKELKIILIAIAVIDDLIAIGIIALFYTTEISMLSLLLASIAFLIAVGFNLAKVTQLTPYVILGFFIWACVLKSGVHATLAGVALGMIIPMKLKNKENKVPLKVMEDTLSPFVSLFVLPLFAFANAGINLQGITYEHFVNTITLGIFLGLFIGKQLGVLLFTVIASFFKLCVLPKGVSWLQFYGMALVTGIGFTMSLFIGTLAFSDITFVNSVRLGVLSASFLSALLGILVLYISHKPGLKNPT